MILLPQIGDPVFLIAEALGNYRRLSHFTQMKLRLPQEGSMDDQWSLLTSMKECRMAGSDVYV
jgi:hypothetical protein